MTYKMRNIGIAVALAVLAALLVSFYVTNYKRHVQQSESHVTVLVAAKDIPAGTPGSNVISHHLLTSERVARRMVVPGAISSPEQIQNLIATQPVFAGEQVTTRRFGTQAERGIRSQIKGTERAFQLPGDANQLLAGTLRAGDHVDIVASWEFPEGAHVHVSRIILRDLVVLQPATAPAGVAKLGAASAPLSVQLKITDSQAQKLYWILENGNWTLVLRPPIGSADSAQGIENSGTLLGDGLTRSRLLEELSRIQALEGSKP